MRYELFIGLRYLRAKRREAFISLITVISMAGVMIGVMTLNIVLAVFTGFEEDLRDRILGFNPHIVVVSYSGSILDYSGLLERVKGVPGVAAAAPFVYGQVMVSSQQNVSGVVVRGVQPTGNGAVDLERHLQEGHLEALAQRHDAPATDGSGGRVQLPGVIVGKELARQLGVVVGDVVNVISPIGTPTAIGMVPRVKRFVAVGVFESGMSEYDAALMYMTLADAQQFFDLTNAVTGVEVRVADLYQAKAVAGRLDAALGFPYRVRDWMEMNRNLFSALKLEKTVYFIVPLLLIQLSGIVDTSPHLLRVEDRMRAHLQGGFQVFAADGLVSLQLDFTDERPFYHGIGEHPAASLVRKIGADVIEEPHPV